MATTISSTAIRAVIIDGPEAGQIITLDAESHLPEVPASATELVNSIENRVIRLNLKAQALLTELRQVNASFKEVES